MRGIAGIVHFDHSPVAPEQIRRMIEAMAICATDRVTHCARGAAGFAHLLQETTVEDRFEDQPLIGGGGNTLLVTDALLDNRDELAGALGWSPSEAAQRPDSAFVRAAWERWGEECPTHLDGEFALAVWQQREQRLFCAVDPMNFRPLYYWRAGAVFAFASTLKGLFSLPGVSTEIDEAVFAESFVGLRRIGEDTLYRAISRIKPAHSLRVEPRGKTTRCYWQPSSKTELRLRSDGDYQEAFRAEFTRAVQSSLRSRREVGIVLSGGLDSSAVAAYGAQLLAAGGRRLQAFHYVPEAAPRYAPVPGRVLDESEFVRAFQASGVPIDFHFPVTRLLPTSEERWRVILADEGVPTPGHAFTEDPAWTELLARTNVGVMLDGLGGNGLVSLETRPNGYLPYLLTQAKWWTLQREFRGHCRAYGAGPKPLLRDVLREAGWLSPARERFSLAYHLLHPELRRRVALADRWREDAECWRFLTLHDFRGMLARSLQHTMPQNSGAAYSVIGRSHTIMGRSPLFDRRLNEFCLSLPLEQHIRDGWDRLLLRQATKGLLPEAVRLRTSRGLDQPDFQQGFLRVREGVLEQVKRLALDGAPWFNSAEIQRILGEHGSTPASFETEQALVAAATWGRFFTHLSPAG